MKLLEKIQIHNFTINNVTQNIIWELDADVNILEGINGSGKTTILEFIYEALRHKDKPENINYKRFERVALMELFFNNNATIIVDEQEAKFINIDLNEVSIDFIRTFDVSNVQGKSVLDTLIAEAKESYVEYKLKMTAAIMNGAGQNIENNTEFQALYHKLSFFTQLINELFARTGKKFNTDKFQFIIDNQEQKSISYESLSSGEKQIFYILLQVLLQEGKSTILLLDEPEISLHLTWQRVLIRYIRQLNPNCQVIAITHSTSVFLEGWVNKFVRMSEIMTTEPILTENITETEEDRNVPEIISEFWNFYDKNIQDYDNSKTRLYKFNKALNEKFYQLSFSNFKQLLNGFKERESSKNEIATPDVVTYTTLISKATHFDLALQMFNDIPDKVTPNILTFNILLKKAANIEQGKTVLNMMETKNIYPDIITFSTLLGKAKNSKETETVEEWRNYYRIEANGIYLNKLKFKK